MAFEKNNEPFPLHFVLFPFMAQGHMIPMVDIARLLAQRGVLITIVTTPHNAARFKNVLNRAIESGLPINLVQVKFPYQEAGLIEEMSPRPSCLISDMCLSYTSEIAKKFKIPKILFHGMGCFCLLCVNVLRKNREILDNLKSDKEYFIVPYFPDRVEFTRPQVPVETYVPAGWKEILEDMVEADKTSYGVIVNSFQELEPAYAKDFKEARSGKAWTIGPVSLCNKVGVDKAERGNKSDIDQDECLEWLDSKEPGSVLYVCLGSICNLPLSQLLELGLGLEESQRPFIWVIRGWEKYKDLDFNTPHLGQIAKIGLIIAIVALTEAIAVGRSFAGIKGYRLDGNKEMVAIGFMNVLGSFTSCYAATGSFSRTAVNFAAGCETAMSNIVMAVTVFVALECLTRLLYYTPIAILASIILSALPGLININEAIHIWKVDKFDFLALIGAFFGVLFASVEIGLLVAVVISFAKIILISIRPGIETLGRMPGTDTFTDTNQYPMTVKTPGVLIFRVKSALLCFANASSIEERIMGWVDEEEEEENTKSNAKRKILFVVLDMSSLINVDTSGITALLELHNKLIKTGVELVIVNPKWQVIHKLNQAKFVDRIGGKVYLTIGEALDACFGLKV